jgi:hypothetical protein
MQQHPDPLLPGAMQRSRNCLTGIFGTIVSLIFALVGAGRTLGSAVLTEGMAIMLSGMNTALTTTATAITCFFIYS